MSRAVIVGDQGRLHIKKQKSLLWKEHGGSCANLVQYFGCGATSNWTQGAIVKGNPDIKPGTCIATFFDGKYPNKSSGNSCTVFISQDGEGIRAHHQAAYWPKPRIDFLEFKDDMSDPSFNGNCYSVILTKLPYKAAPGFKKGYAQLATNPATTPDLERVLTEVNRRHPGKYDKSIRKALEEVLKDGVLTLNDIEAIIKSAQDKNKRGTVYNKYELTVMDSILDRAQTLDDKCRKRLKQFLQTHSKR